MKVIDWLLIISMWAFTLFVIIELRPIEVTPTPIEVISTPNYRHYITRAQYCAQFLRETPGEWDATTETYPRNLEWEACIGVDK